MLPLHIGADHLGYLPLILAVGVILFIAATALRTKLERMAGKPTDDKASEAPRADRHRND